MIDSVNITPDDVQVMIAELDAQIDRAVARSRFLDINIDAIRFSERSHSVAVLEKVKDEKRRVHADISWLCQVRHELIEAN